MNELRSRPDRIRMYGSQVIATLGRQQWLDRPSYRFEHTLTVVFAALGRHRERVSNVLHGTWLGHPLHPALTALPTGAVATAVALDAASVLPGRTAAMRDASRLALGVGIVGQCWGRGDRRDGLATHPWRGPPDRDCAWPVERRRDRAVCGVVVGSSARPPFPRSRGDGAGLRPHDGKRILGRHTRVRLGCRCRSFGPTARGRGLDTGAARDSAERPAAADRDRRRRRGLAPRRRRYPGRRRVLPAPGSADVGRLGRSWPRCMPLAWFTIRMPLG